MGYSHVLLDLIAVVLYAWFAPEIITVQMAVGLSNAHQVLTAPEQVYNYQIVIIQRQNAVQIQISFVDQAHFVKVSGRHLFYNGYGFVMNAQQDHIANMGHFMHALKVIHLQLHLKI